MVRGFRKKKNYPCNMGSYLHGKESWRIILEENEVGESILKGKIGLVDRIK